VAGKALSGSAHRAWRHRHLLSAVTHASVVPLAQREVGAGNNETAAFSPLRARLLRVDPSSVRRWRAERPPQGPPFIRLSERVVLYDEDDLHQWLSERRTAPAAGRKAA
jgi:hypothetical protein